MKKYPVILTTCCLFLLNFKSTAQQVQVTIVNKSDYRLDSLTVNDMYIGTINASRDTLIFYKNMVTDTGQPVVKAFANVDGQKIYTPEIYTECATMHRVNTSGRYTLNLKVLQNSNGPFLYIELPQ